MSGERRGVVDDGSPTGAKGANMSDGSIEVQVVGAIRLALEGAADDETAIAMVTWLVGQAPDTNGGDTSSVTLFIEGIRSLGGSVTLPEQSRG